MANPSASTKMNRRGRRGLSLMEVLVVIAILMVMLAVLVPSVMSILQLQQRKAATDLALLYNQLHDESVLYNATFRIRYNLPTNQYTVDVGETRAVIYSSPEQRERYEEERRQKLATMSEDERREFLASHKPFGKLQAKFKTEFTLPRNTRIYAVYTPQYGKFMTLEDLKDFEEDESKDLYSYVFSTGFTEHTLIWITDDVLDPDDGYTVEVEPLSGKVHVHGELIQFEDSFEWVPDEGPDLPT